MRAGIPIDAHGACDDWRLAHAAPARALSRRSLLLGGTGLVVGALGLPGVSPQRILEAARADAAARPDGRILVSLYLDGGNDGLNTLVPLTDGRYRELRPRLAVRPQDTLPLHDTREFGWHPALAGLRELYDAGQVAVLPSVDYADPDLSHFNSAAFWRTGIAGPTLDRSGWLGRTLDAVGSMDNPLQGISATWGLDPVLISRRAPVATVIDPSDFGFWIPGVWDDDTPLRPIREIAAKRARHPALQAAREAYAGAVEVKGRLAPLAKEKEPAKPPRAYPDTHLGKSMRSLARMLGAGFGTRIAAVTSGGGFDTHENQLTDHPKLLRDVGDSLAAWQADLVARGLAGRVITLVWSEFGRRPQDNDSNGTDHGAGGLVLVVGERAQGGIQSEFPGLARLDPFDNLRVTTEFRTVYASLLESWLGVEAERVLGRVRGARLALVRP